MSLGLVVPHDLFIGWMNPDVGDDTMWDAVDDRSSRALV